MKRASLFILLGVGVAGLLPISSIYGTLQGVGVNYPGQCTFLLAGDVLYTDPEPTVSITPQGALVCVGSTPQDDMRSISNDVEGIKCVNDGVEYSSWTQIINPNGQGVLICNP